MTPPDLLAAPISDSKGSAVSVISLTGVASKSAPVYTRRDLAAILPRSIRAEAEDYLLHQPRLAAALRLLACVESIHWQSAVTGSRVDAWALLASLGPYRSYEDRDRVLVEAAACFADPDGVHIPMTRMAERLCDDEDFTVLVDALRIAREGLAA